MGKVDIRTALSEGLTEKTDKARGEAESLLEELFGQFNVLEKQQKMVTEALQRYVAAKMLVTTLNKDCWSLCQHAD